MNRLAENIAGLIRQAGPLGVADYMALCLFDPQHGYYTTREPFGAGGDFITAPDISQMFGELVAVWLYSACRASGTPLPVTIAEIGPGRGTLAADMARTLGRIDPQFAATCDLALIETSPRLADVQRRMLAATGMPVSWPASVEALPDRPVFFVGNEIFDAIPIRQFVKSGDVWRERVVSLDEAGAFRFATGLDALDERLLPRQAADAGDGAVFEIAPARTALLETVADRIARHGGAALFFDYGHLEPGLGDTLQAVRGHDHCDVFETPGEADLTSHVDFAALSAAAQARGLAAHTMTQGAFLLAMGLAERAGRLGAAGDAALRERLTSEAERLAGADQMGELFKVLALLPHHLDVHPFPAAD
ncbi:class I SAM-dependent methyltransferase [Nitratireductor sp. CAU 1489]|uniref:Class I SAM-dependent methyltransferase n=1 Tax=Nitratireductor arenosus TaxID=2682096 RepID=A0A844QNF6_9HYPH|nr:class I SAM-dependent methyltransferase [Nitratireductor arenosus]MVA99480.1 class I SAM-dependent methyltransferase [Nitratireductor arenosus]